MAKQKQHPSHQEGKPPNEEFLGRLINEFFDRRESGENLSQEAFLDEHTEFADALREHFVGLDLLDGIGSSSQQSTLIGDGLMHDIGESSAESSSQSLKPPEIPGYEIHKLIGRGGMGLVYKATQRSMNRQVALKLLLEGPLASEQSRRRFEREIALAAQLRHRSIIPIYDSGSFDGRMYYTMEYVRGMALGDYLKAHELGIEAKLRLFIDICQAVQHAHQQGIVHRDLKPGNILIDSEGKPHLLDFGLAKAASYIDNKTSVTAQIVGTPAYMSPEQVAGDPSGIDVRTDIYSLGVVLYEMLTGRMPYETKIPMGKLLQNISHSEPTPLREYNKKIDGEISAILCKALKKNKEDRYQSLDSFSNDISRYLAGEPISIKPVSGFFLLRKALKKHRSLIAVTTILMIVATGVGLTIRTYVTQLHEADARNQVREQKLAEQLAQSKLLLRDAQTLAKQRDEAKKISEAYRSALRLIDPEVAKGLDMLTRGLSDPQTAIPKLFAGIVSDLKPDATTTAPAKESDLNLDAPLMSRKPIDTTPSGQAAKTQITPELLRLLRSLVPPAPPSPKAATSRPATTQPSDQDQPDS